MIRFYQDENGVWQPRKLSKNVSQNGIKNSTPSYELNSMSRKELLELAIEKGIDSSKAKTRIQLHRLLVQALNEDHADS